MKRKSIYNTILAVFVIAAGIFAACTKENTEVKLPPQLATSQILDIKSDSATVVGFVVAAGSGFTEKGICYGTQPSPTTDNNKVVYDTVSKQATYTVKLSGLHYATKYYVRAYGINTNDTVYGDELTFTTAPIKPTVTTAAITAVTNGSATCGGTVTNDGGAEITERGVVYSTDPNPTLSNDAVVDANGGTGTFVSNITGLVMKTTYHVRAYATNSAGTSYGGDSTFTTANVTKLWVVGDFQGWDNSDNAPTLNLKADGTYEGYVNMTSNNGFKIVSDHSWDNAHTYGDDGNNPGTADNGVLTLSGGQNITLLHGIGYMKIDVDLTTLTYSTLITTWSIIGNATPGGWSTDTPLTYDAVNNVWTVTVDLTQQSPPNDGFKFRANNAWNINYGDTGADGTLELSGTNIGVPSNGNYTITLDLSGAEYTYTMVKN